MSIVVVEPDPALACFLRKAIEAEQYTVEVVSSCAAAVQRLAAQDCELVLLGNNPTARESAGDQIGRLRTARANVPVLALIASASSEARAQILNAGADDCLSKPISLAELSARIRALLRRRAPTAATLTIADLEFDRLQRRVKRAGKEIELTTKEFALLEYLMCNAGQPMTRAMIGRDVWSLPGEMSTNIVDVYINYLRKKVDQHFAQKLIRTVRGVGYMLGTTTAASAAARNTNCDEAPRIPTPSFGPSLAERRFA